MRIEDILGKETFVTSVVFNEDTMEVTFLEKNDQSENIMMAKTMIVPIYPDDEERVILFAEIQDSLCDLIDRAYIELRTDETGRPSGKAAIHKRMVEG